MKQVLIKKGYALPIDVPQPKTKEGCLKIRVLYSCISTGTEIKGVDDSGKSLLQKAIDNPQKVQQALDMLKTKGLKKTANKISSSEDSWKAQGYSISGIVEEIGSGVAGFNVGDLVSGGGQGFAVHAEYVVIPKNLVTKVPNGVCPEYASIGTVGSIALHGVRRADLKLGEYAVVFGTGLLGLLALQMLSASGVRVACIDIDETRLSIAKELGCELAINSNLEDPVEAIVNWTTAYGADAVLYTAASSDADLVSQCFKMCRRKGRVVIVGVAPLQIERSDMYSKEIDLMISSSYGPGRYDNKYELEGIDYPYAYVRWTENRNIFEFLRLVEDGKVRIEPLKPMIYSLDNVTLAYESLKEHASTHLLSLISYAKADEASTSHRNDDDYKILVKSFEPNTVDKVINIGLIGAGGFATGQLLPIISAMKGHFSLTAIANRNGEKAKKAAHMFSAEYATSDYEKIINDDKIHLVMICTRHDSHAKMVVEALKKGKHVYVEKPLATNDDELNQIEKLYSEGLAETQLFVGFNRRFSKYTKEIQKHIGERLSPLFIRYRMNAGLIPYDSWVHEDGGRIVGEACHIIDLMSCLTGSEVLELSVNSIRSVHGMFQGSDNRSITLRYVDGSVCVIDYFAMGSKHLSKENMQIHFDGKSIIMDDYKSLSCYGLKLNSISSKTSQKGHEEEWKAVYNSIITGIPAIPLKSLVETTRLSIIASKDL